MVTEDNIEVPADPQFPLDRWFDADRIKLQIPLYTDQVGDEDAMRKFGDPDLGGPSGPKTLHEYRRYSAEARHEFEVFL